MPTATDLVTDLPADFEVFGQAVDTALMDLRGGTTGQVLAKNSATDMDFIWTAGGDITGVTAGTGISGGGTSGDVTVTNSMATAMTTSGDLIQATGSGTFARLGTGTNGQYLTTNGTTNSWGTISAGGMTQIASGSLASSANIRIQSIPATYKMLRLWISNPLGSVTNFTPLLGVNNDTGNNYINWVDQGYNGTRLCAPAGGPFMNSDTSNTAGNGFICVDFPDYASTSHYKQYIVDGSMMNDKTTSTSFQVYRMVNGWLSNTAINEINIRGYNNYTSGTYVLYGVN
jgi:hypothetical protein